MGTKNGKKRENIGLFARFYFEKSKSRCYRFAMAQGMLIARKTPPVRHRGRVVGV